MNEQKQQPLFQKDFTLVVIGYIIFTDDYHVAYWRYYCR